jgi:hypothetical protein
MRRVTMSDWLADYLDWKADHPDPEEAQQAASTVDAGLDALFRRLSPPPTDHADEK